ncbi:hypothetical protein PG984_007520 [Apiospora sp. TS-2023a]
MMGAFNIFSTRGWRRTGLYNIALVAILGILLIVWFCISYSRQPYSLLFSTTLIRRGRCKDTANLNIILHLILNIISTGILSSSNFFMQIVTSPSRPEIDVAHAYLRSLDIGFQSLRNVPSLSHFKQSCWLLLLLSTIPIHLLFNSAIFETRVQENAWNLTIATEEFIRVGQYWPPGASLTTSGASSPALEFCSVGDVRDQYGVPGCSRRVAGYGYVVEIGEYWKQAGTARESLKDISRKASSWDLLETERCMREFRPTEPRARYKSLVIIVDTGTTEPRGWRRTDVYDFDPKTNLLETWDPHVPPSQLNSLWYSAFCSQGTYQTNVCGRLLGLGTDKLEDTNHITKEVKPISFLDDGLDGATTSLEVAKGYRAKLRTLNIRHCVAEPMEGCQVRVYNFLILIVTLCAVTKVAACSILVWRLKHTPLVTPGDALESFIAFPDHSTDGVSTMSIHDSQVLEFSPRRHYNGFENNGTILTIQPRRYQGHPRKLSHAVSRRIWVQACYPISVSLVAILIVTGVTFTWPLSGSFGPSLDSSIFSIGEPVNPIQALLVANLPQLILSFCYLLINNLFTQLQAEQEWNSYAQTYKPLRVSYPEGGQLSTYRLQLPYKYSVPLIAMSAVLHWLVSNSIYFLVIDGGMSNILRALWET